jgi:hypothetical protein
VQSFLNTPITYTITRSFRKTLTLQVSPNAEVMVRAPRWAPAGIIDRFVKDRLPWLQRTLERVQKNRKIPRQFTDGEIFDVWGRTYSLSLIDSPTRKIKASIENDRLLVGLTRDRWTAAILRPAIREFYRQQLSAQLELKLPERAALMGVRYQTFSIGFAEHRWGSCIAGGRLRFNGRLAMMPPEIMDYVIVHELAHLKELNHSSRFWTHVKTIRPTYQEERRWLRLNGTAYFL